MTTTTTTTAIVEQPSRELVSDIGRMSVTAVTQHAIAVQEVMQAVMKPNVHFGQIPGTDKPTLYKAGAEKLCMTFRISDEYKTDDLSTEDAIRYRIVCVGRHQTSGIELGSGIGECSSAEEKYRWRRAVCKQEWDATPPAMRRIKYARGKGGTHYTQEQVRTEPMDLANTVLKMAAKRAKMAMVLNVLACSDIFGQDLEDLDATLREHLADEDGRAAAPPVRPALPDYPEEAFDANLPKWATLVGNGRKTAPELLATLSTKATFSEQQKAAILSLRKAPPPADAEPAAVEPAPGPPGPHDQFLAEFTAEEEGGQK